MKYIAIWADSGYKCVPVENESEVILDAVTGLSASMTIKDSQIKALTERNEFLEDLIAELAVQAYSKTPNA